MVRAVWMTTLRVHWAVISWYIMVTAAWVGAAVLCCAVLCCAVLCCAVSTVCSVEYTPLSSEPVLCLCLYMCMCVCSVPIDTTSITTLYVFVDIAIDVPHLIRTVQLNFPKPDTALVLAGTIQFATAMQIARTALTPHYKHLFIPQAKPLSRTVHSFD
jgi:hypothetical protein